MTTEGFITLHRKIREHPYWHDPERLKAWIDVLFMAAWKKHRRLIGTMQVELDRGQFLASERFLADRWGWSRGKVRRWIEAARDADEIAPIGDTSDGTIYLVVKYDDYQSDRPTNGTTRSTSNGPPTVPAPDQREEREEGKEGKQQKKPSAKKRASQLPESWKPNSHHSELARSRGVNVGEQAAMFKDHHLAKGSTFVDWDRAFNTWLRRAKQYERPTPPSPGSQAAQVRNEKPRQEVERTGKLTLVGKDQTEQEERRAKIDAWKRENAEKLDELRDTAVREMELALTAFGRKPEVAQRLVETKVDEMIWNQKLQGAA